MTLDSLACSRFSFGSDLLKALLAGSLGSAALWLFPAVGRAQPQPCINTHSSLGLGCLTREELDRKIREWASNYRTVPGFAKQWGLGTIHADHAYAHLKAVKGGNVKPGEGVTIGFMDSGIDEDHPSFADIQVTETLLQNAEDETGGRSSHGTMVASVAAGGRISSGPHRDHAHHGVAWGADVAMFPFSLYEDHPWYDPRFFKSLKDDDNRDSELLQSALDEDIDILNLSVTLGSRTIIEDYKKQKVRKDYSKTIATIAQADAEEKTIFVWSAGNSHNRLPCDLQYVDRERCINVQHYTFGKFGKVNASSPQLMAGLPALIPELRGHSIAAVAVKSDGVISNWSNRCGIAADWCIAAPGQDVRAAYFGPANGKDGVRDWRALSGTSFAAPMVSGSLAVMKQLFRGQLSNTELVSRLFTTANKTGIYANRAIYGQGLLDLGAATNPWGVATFMGPGQSVGEQAQATATGSTNNPTERPSSPLPCPGGTIRTHASLGLGCITRKKWNRKVEEWAKSYRADPGFAKQWGLGAINADRAYAHLKAVKGKNVKPGEGVTIGFIDGGIDQDHPAFLGKKITEEFFKDTKDETGDRSSHGTATAGVAVGNRISSGPNKGKPHGVAWGADIAMLGLTFRAFLPFYSPRSLEKLKADDDDHSTLFKSALKNNVDILNLSIAIVGNIEDYSEAQLRNNYSKTIATLAQAGAQEKTILVWAAANYNTKRCKESEIGSRCANVGQSGLGWVNASSPEIWPGLVARIEELRGHSIAVVAANTDGSIAYWSNRCGIAADWCITAPGVNLGTAVFGPSGGQNGVRGWGSSGGTSAAAPMVSGSLAVMRQLFRDQLSNTELVTRLFATAKKTGIHANRAIYGQGFLDLGAATNPWGVASFTGTGQSVGQQIQGTPDEPESNPCGQNTINTHSSLDLGCLTREALNDKVQEWATAYRAVAGFGKQWGLGAVHADRAYAHLKAVKGESVKPGQGVTIGFVDSGMDRSHPSFAASKVSETLLQGAAAETGTRMSHGTAVASVAAGGPISSGPHQNKAHHGVAWGADIAMFAVPGEAYPTKEFSQPLSRKELQAREDGDSELFQSVLREDIDILNVSFPGFHLPATIEDYRRARLIKNYSKTIAALAQGDEEEKTILVWSAGDVDPSRGQTPGSSPQPMAGLPAKIKELRGHSVTVVATKQDGAIADFSNRCGIAADWCIAAPGVNVRTAYYGPSGGQAGSQDWSTLSSTSVAAPVVSGGLAVMKQLFRGQLSNTELVSRLFTTAKKTGIHADSSIYGQGLMDLGAATNPWGMAAFMGTGQAVGAQGGGDSVGQQSDGGVELGRTSLSLGPAMGDGLSHALAQQEVAAFDSLGAPFWFPADSFTLPSEGPSLAARLQQFLAPSVEHTVPESWQVDFQADAPALEAGHLALTHGADRLRFHGPQGLSATLFQRPADYDQAPLAGLAVSWNPQALPALSLSAGYLQEQEELLGSQGSGAFGELSGHTLFLSTELDTTTQGWELSAQGELGMVNPAVARSQFISDISTLTSSAFRLQARKPLDNGVAFRLALSQPLRVESGAATLSLPTGRTKDGLVVGTDLSAPLPPSGRQLDLTAQLDLPLLGGELSLAATHSRQPQHQRGAEGQWTFFTGYRANW